MKKLIRRAVGAIITKNNKFLLVHKEKINTKNGKITVDSEWDFVKGGVEAKDATIEAALLRELNEETGSSLYTITKKFDNKICFTFPESIQQQIGYKMQETTMFHVEYKGEANTLCPSDDEISEFKFVSKETVLKLLKHEDTKQFFLSYFLDPLQTQSADDSPLFRC